MTRSKGKRNRLQFDFSDAGVKQIEKIQKTLDAGSRAEVVRRALRLLGYVLTQDGDVIYRDSNGKETVISIL